jgi:ComF family protein
MVNRLKKIIQKSAAQLINCYPKYCLLCSRKTKNVYLICNHCLLQLPYVKQACFMCGLKIMGNAVFCGQCLKKSNAFDRVIVPFYYKKPITALLFQLKFHEKLASLSFFSYFLIKKLKQRTDSLPEVIIPVPLHRKRMQTRGYNQSLELAKQLSQALNICLDRHCCQRIKPTRSQQGLNIKIRKKNVRHAFVIRKKIIYQHVAIVDDVMTTMATVNEISKCLKKQGVSIVEVWCCARA